MNIVEGTLTVESIEQVAQNTKKFIFKSDPDFSFQAGQFLSLQFGETSWRAYSIASAPHEGRIEFVIRYVDKGLASEILWNTKVGDSFPFKGPFGGFVLSNNPDAHLIFCGTGTGIAPLRSMILTENQKPHPRPITLLYGGRSAADIAYLNEISSWSSDLQVQLGLSQDASKSNLPSQKCRITEFLPEFLENENNEFYICGNGDMVKSVTEILTQNGVEKTKIFMERFN